ncbi:MAG TPA: T9SS type A sorting domain-containing protein, partial [Candidatus Marinimicrobia bacterium]|nr:T9SS type A sorting domain-containing protein [Candidatus Neomarinimicrobiota bacterium]
WFGGTVVDTATTFQFNGISFGFNKDLEATQVNLYEVMVDIGDPIDVPPAPWEAYFIDQWGFIGNKSGGWHLTPQIAGDVEISGDNAPTGWAAISGNFGEPVAPSTDKALLISGSLTLTGGGFEDLASLRFGIFYGDSLGTLDSTDIGYAWNGSDAHQTGYLFVPPSESNVATWGTTNGTVGTIVDDQWFNINSGTVLSSVLQWPANSIGAAGTYDFEISISPQTGGNNLINFNFLKTDGSYGFAHSVTDATPASDKFNNIAFAINNSTTTSMYIEAVQIDKGESISVDIKEGTKLPTVYALRQNYPNPFNPTTMIEFDLPKQSDVKLVVYDIMGRKVAELASGKLNAGYHKLNFNAAHLASGVYFYKLQAGDFVSIKKMMLLK